MKTIHITKSVRAKHIRLLNSLGCDISSQNTRFNLLYRYIRLAILNYELNIYSFFPYIEISLENENLSKNSSQVTSKYFKLSTFRKKTLLIITQSY